MGIYIYICTLYPNTHHVPEQLLQTFVQVFPPVSRSCSEWKLDGFPQQRHHWSTVAVVFFKATFRWEFLVSTLYPIGSMYGIYANIWGILMVNVTIYSIHGSYGYHENWGVSVSLSDF